MLLLENSSTVTASICYRETCEPQLKMALGESAGLRM